MSTSKLVSPHVTKYIIQLLGQQVYYSVNESTSTVLANNCTIQPTSTPLIYEIN